MQPVPLPPSFGSGDPLPNADTDAHDDSDDHERPEAGQNRRHLDEHQRGKGSLPPSSLKRFLKTGTMKTNIAVKMTSITLNTTAG